MGHDGTHQRVKNVVARAGRPRHRGFETRHQLTKKTTTQEAGNQRESLTVAVIRFFRVRHRNASIERRKTQLGMSLEPHQTCCLSLQDAALDLANFWQQVESLLADPLTPLLFASSVDGVVGGFGNCEARRRRKDTTSARPQQSPRVAVTGPETIRGQANGHVDTHRGARRHPLDNVLKRRHQ